MPSCYCCDRPGIQVKYCGDCIEKAIDLIAERNLFAYSDEEMHDKAVNILDLKNKQKWDRYTKAREEWEKNGAKGDPPVPGTIKLPKKKGENMLAETKDPITGKMRIEGVSDIAQSAVKEVLEEEKEEDLPACHKPKSWPYRDIEWKHKDCPNCKKERDFTYNKVKDIYHCNYCCVKFRPHEWEEKKEGKIKVKKSEEEKPLKNLCSCDREIEWGQAYCPDCSKDFCLVEVEPEMFQSVKKETGTFKRLREVFQSEELMEISEIQILGNTTRREVDDNKVNELANSIKEIGLLNPITITPGKMLIAGLHRMKAFCLLGETEIPCRIVNLTDLEAELAEIDENLIRNELDYLDRGTQYERRQGIYEQLYPETKKEATLKQYRNADSAERTKPSFVEDTSRKTGKSSRVIQEELQISKKVIPEAKTVLKEKDIPKTEALKLSRKTPEEQKQIIDKIQSGEAATVKQAIRQEKREKFFTPDIPLPKEEFNLILADPPWQHDNQSSRGAAQDHYPTMNLQDIKDLGKKLPASENSICFLWAVNSMLPEAIETLLAWGYKYKTNCVWTKPFIGVGNWVRTQHELLLIGVKGNFPTPAEADRKSSIITGKSTEHSKKT